MCTWADLLARVQNTSNQYNMPEVGKNIAYGANRDGVAERFADLAAQKALKSTWRSSRRLTHDLSGPPQPGAGWDDRLGGPTGQSGAPLPASPLGAGVRCRSVHD